MSELSQRVNAPSLSLDEQYAIVARLRAAVDRPREREAARELFERLQAREDVFHAVARDLSSLLDGPSSAGPATTGEPSRPAPGPVRGDEPKADARHAAAKPSSSAPPPGNGWQVEVTEKTAYTRSIMVTGRQPHSLAFKVRLVPKGKTLFSMDEMRFDHNGVSPWQRFERQFKVMDCNEFLPVEIKIRLDYRYSIKSVLLIMGGVTVYEEDRP